MVWTGTRRTVLTAAGLALLSAGCQVKGDRTTEEPRSPFTGEQRVGDQVLAVKIDNVRPARPQTGLDQADLVYVEQVEAGLTRIMAVFASRIPGEAGPVRSARESDLELLRQFDRPAFCYSGVQSRLRDRVESAHLIALPPGRLPDGYVRRSGRPAPHNLYLRPEVALRAASDASPPRDIGFRFGSAPSGGRTAQERTVRYPAASYGFNWSADEERWLVSMDGEPAVTDGGDRLGPPTVVVQSVRIRSSAFGDRGGNNTPFTVTVGSGRALVLRGGREYDARWSRPDAAGGTTFTDADGRRLRFARGQVWVLLAPAG